jgi:hypothetical protein
VVANSFYTPEGSRVNACTAPSIPFFTEKRRQVFTNFLLIDAPCTFLPAGYGLSPDELSKDSWSRGILERWQKGMESGEWSASVNAKTGMSLPLEAEMVIISLYLGATFIRNISIHDGGVHASAMLLGKVHDLLCGLAHLLGVQKRVMPGPLASGKLKPPTVPGKHVIPQTLLLVLNRDFLVRLMLDMGECLIQDPASLDEGMATIHMCQSFNSDLWGAEAK